MLTKAHFALNFLPFNFQCDVLPLFSLLPQIQYYFKILLKPESSFRTSRLPFLIFGIRNRSKFLSRITFTMVF